MLGVCLKKRHGISYENDVIMFFHQSHGIHCLQVLAACNCFKDIVIVFISRPSRPAGLGDLFNQSCKPLHPRVVFYNRIFKAASTTMSELLQKSSRILNNKYTKGRYIKAIVHGVAEI